MLSEHSYVWKKHGNLPEWSLQRKTVNAEHASKKHRGFFFHWAHVSVRSLCSTSLCCAMPSPFITPISFGVHSKPGHQLLYHNLFLIICLHILHLWEAITPMGCKDHWGTCSKTLLMLNTELKYASFWSENEVALGGNWYISHYFHCVYKNPTQK